MHTTRQARLFARVLFATVLLSIATNSIHGAFAAEYVDDVLWGPISALWNLNSMQLGRMKSLEQCDIPLERVVDCVFRYGDAQGLGYITKNDIDTQRARYMSPLMRAGAAVAKPTWEIMLHCDTVSIERGDDGEIVDMTLGPDGHIDPEEFLTWRTTCLKNCDAVHELFTYVCERGQELESQNIDVISPAYIEFNRARIERLSQDRFKTVEGME